MPNILIADSGSTKTHWVLKNDKGIIREFYSQGINPLFVSTENIIDIISKIISHDEMMSISIINFYGAGCKGVEKCEIIKSAFSKLFPNALIVAKSDLLGAAISLFANNSGVACILGTGSNAAIFDGSEFTDSISSLGFILGDEGSGSYMGKILIRDYFQHNMPDNIYSKFNTRFSLEYSEVINSVYREQYPNRYLAQFTVFLSENRGEKYVESLLEDSFQAFVDNQLSKLGFDKKNIEIGFVGSIAYYFKDTLKKILLKNDYTIGNVYKEPIQGLIL